MSLPAGYRLFQSVLTLLPKGASNGHMLASNLGAGPDLSFVVPVLDGATFGVTVCAASDAAATCRTLPSLTAGTLKAPMGVEPGLELISPAPGASVGVGSEIQWSAPVEGPAFVLLYPAKATPLAPSYYLAAADGSAVLPDLGAIGVKVKPGVDYNLEVFRNGAESVDELAAKGPFSSYGPGPSTYAYSLMRTVKSQ